MGLTRTQQCLQLRKEAGGGVTRSLLRYDILLESAGILSSRYSSQPFSWKSQIHFKILADIGGSQFSNHTFCNFVIVNVK